MVARSPRAGEGARAVPAASGRAGGTVFLHRSGGHVDTWRARGATGALPCLRRGRRLRGRTRHPVPGGNERHGGGISGFLLLRRRPGSRQQIRCGLRGHCRRGRRQSACRSPQSAEARALSCQLMPHGERPAILNRGGSYRRFGWNHAVVRGRRHLPDTGDAAKGDDFRSTAGYRISRC